MDEHRYAMILAGGSGTRLWPMSRRQRPKQLLPLVAGETGDGPPRSLLQLAADRLSGLVNPGRLLVCTQESYRGLVASSLPQVVDENVLGEPTGRDTLNAVGLAAAVLALRDPEAICCVTTADHVITPTDRFAEVVRRGFELVEASGRTLVTFAIEPTHAATGYGYVRRGEAIGGTGGFGHRVERFVEKPDADRAREYVASGRYGWNSGMFVWRARTLLDCIEAFAPESAAGLGEIADAWQTPRRDEVLGRVYPELPKISVDYAVMEPATSGRAAEVAGGVDVATLRMDVRWLDVGSWSSYAQVAAPDASGNRLAGTGGGGTIAVDSRDNLVVTDQPGHTVALLGCEGLVVVHTPDATLVMPADRAEGLKDLHAALPDGLR